MLITLITLGFFILLFIPLIIWRNEYNSIKVSISLGAFALAVISFFALGWMTISIVVAHVNPEGQYQAALATREALVYRLENEYYDNDNNVGATELFQEIAEWNADVISSQKGVKDPWTSWFYAPWYLDLELIPLDPK